MRRLIGGKQTDSEKRYALRLKVILKFGGKCKKCGFSDWRALQIDHVNGGGHKESKERGDLWIMKQALADSEGKYQLLCANCNVIKKFEKQEYPLKAKNAETILDSIKSGHTPTHEELEFLLKELNEIYEGGKDVIT